MSDEIRLARSDADVAEVRRLFEEYAAWIGIDLGFQGFAEEMARLPGEYVEPQGALFLARIDGDVVGCIGVRPFEWPAVEEVKRLWVSPAGRGHGFGRRLSERALAFARDAGYERARLDTLPSMLEAQAIYEALGFHDIEAYRFNPVGGTRYLELDLHNEGPKPERRDDAHDPTRRTR